MAGAPHRLPSWDRARIVAAALALGAATLGGACDGDEHEAGTEDRPGLPTDVAVRECAGASRSGGAHLDLDSPLNVRAGPLIVYVGDQYADAAKADFAPVRLRGDLRDAASPEVRRQIHDRSLFGAVKLLLVIEGSRAVTIAIPKAERGNASLLYAAKRGYTGEERRLGLAQVSDGHSAVRLEPCTKGRGRFTEFPGGLVVAGARCLQLDVWVAGSGMPIERALSFGAGERC
jgi:hypothetical protein